MSFQIYVMKRTGDAFLQRLPPDQEEWDAWFAAYEKLTLYNAPLGADETIYQYWSLIADQLNLHMISAIYQHGLRIEDAEGLARFERELNQLEEYWNTYKLEDTSSKSAIRDHLREHLQERMNHCREALRVAREYEGVLGIS